jgi:D-proline reductase (dithiol) PrdB
VRRAALRINLSWAAIFVDVARAGKYACRMATNPSAPIAYMPRTRRYYAALGYAPYQWAHNIEVPFAPLTKPLAESKLVLITTAAPARDGLGPQGPGAPYNAAAKFFRAYSAALEPTPDLRISHLNYDRTHTTAEDPGTWLPVERLREQVSAGRIGALADALIGIPTNRSQRVTREQDAPDVRGICRTLGADVALLVPTCPVCHQTMALLAWHLEHHGIPTVIMGCAQDILEHVGTPRFLFSDFPLGNSAGKPHDAESQRRTLALALDLLESARAARTSWTSAQVWQEDPSWKADYLNVDGLSADEIERHKREFQEQKTVARQLPR